MDWQDYFNENILDRGFEYYNTQEIAYVHKHNNRIEAKVTGSKDYYIHIDTNDINNMTCTCPYCRQGSYCKHLAAVLFYLDDHHDLTNDNNEQQINQEIDDLFKDYKAAAGHYNEDNFIILFSLLEENDYKIYYQLINKLEQYLNDINKDFYNEFSALTYLMTKIKNIIDTSYYRALACEGQNFNHVISLVFARLETIIENGDERLKEQIFNWLLSQLKETYCLKNSTRLLFKYYSNNTYQQKTFDFIDSHLDNPKTFKELIYLKLDILKKEQKDDALNEIYNKYFNNSDVRLYMIQSNIDSKNYEKAKDIIRKSQILDFNNKNLTYRYSRALLHIDYLEKNKKAYTQELWNMILIFDNGDDKIISLLNSDYALKDDETDSRMYQLFLDKVNRNKNFYSRYNQLLRL